VRRESITQRKTKEGGGAGCINDDELERNEEEMGMNRRRGWGGEGGRGGRGRGRVAQ